MSSGRQLGRIQLVLDVGYDAANRPPVEKSASTHVSANAPANSSAVVRAQAKLRTAARESYSKLPSRSTGSGRSKRGTG